MGKIRPRGCTGSSNDNTKEVEIDRTYPDEEGGKHHKNSWHGLESSG